MSHRQVPRGAECLLESLAPKSEFRDAILGDLAEEYEMRVEWDGRNVARRWYWRESLRVAPHLLRDWMRGLRWADAGYFANGMAISLIAIYVVAQLAGRGLAAILFAVSNDGNFLRHAIERGSIGAVIFLHAWGLCHGVFAGYVASLIVRRAPLQAAAAMSAVPWILFALLLTLGHQDLGPTSLWLWIANTAAMSAGALAGGLLHTLRRGASEPEAV